MIDIPALFHDLQPLAAPTAHKPDPHENLTDILEIVSVASGLRLAHLQGQGNYDGARITALEQLATERGLSTMRTKTLIPHFHRARRFDQRIIDFEDAEALQKQLAAPDVLWVYDDPQAAAMIPRVVAGQVSVSRLLGYPSCCVDFHSEQKITLAEAYVQGIINAYPGSTPEEIAALWQQSVQVPVAVDPDADIPQTRASLERFPYVQFVACPTCLGSGDSPATRANVQARTLAFELARSFGKEIWQARDLVINRGRPMRVGRNDTCPCGRGAKFKKCCGQ